MLEAGLFGLFGGLLIFTSVAIWHSTHFQKSQKIFLTICILFPPAQWVFAIIIYAYNKSNDTLIDYKQDISSKDLEKLTYLKNSKILSDEEYDIKASKIKTESILNDIKKTDEYKALYQLNKRGILNDREFDEKIKLLSEKQTSNNSNKTTTNTNPESKPINDLPIKLKDVIIPNKLKREMGVSTTTLAYMLINSNRYIKYFKNEEFPFYCALVLETRKYKLTKKQLDILNNIARDYFNMEGYKEKLVSMKIKK